MDTKVFLGTKVLRDFLRTQKSFFDTKGLFLDEAVGYWSFRGHRVGNNCKFVILENEKLSVSSTKAAQIAPEFTLMFTPRHLKMFLYDADKSVLLLFSSCTRQSPSLWWEKSEQFCRNPRCTVYRHRSTLWKKVFEAQCSPFLYAGPIAWPHDPCDHGSKSPIDHFWCRRGRGSRSRVLLACRPMSRSTQRSNRAIWPCGVWWRRSWPEVEAMASSFFDASFKKISMSSFQPVVPSVVALSHPSTAVEITISWTSFVSCCWSACNCCCSLDVTERVTGRTSDGANSGSSLTYSWGTQMSESRMRGALKCLPKTSLHFNGAQLAIDVKFRSALGRSREAPSCRRWWVSGSFNRQLCQCWRYRLVVVAVETRWRRRVYLAISARVREMLRSMVYRTVGIICTGLWWSWRIVRRGVRLCHFWLKFWHRIRVDMFECRCFFLSQNKAARVGFSTVVCKAAAVEAAAGKSANTTVEAAPTFQKLKVVAMVESRKVEGFNGLWPWSSSKETRRAEGVVNPTRWRPNGGAPEGWVFLPLSCFKFLFFVFFGRCLVKCGWCWQC